MRLDSEKAYRYLMENKRLVTLRSYPYRKGQHVRIYHRGRYVGRAVVEDVIPSEVLFFMANKYINKIVELSGFSSIDEWLEEARRLYRRETIPPYIVIIKLEKVKG